jgi:hypothetical protein
MDSSAGPVAQDPWQYDSYAYGAEDPIVFTGWMNQRDRDLHMGILDLGILLWREGEIPWPRGRFSPNCKSEQVTFAEEQTIDYIVVFVISALCGSVLGHDRVVIECKLFHYGDIPLRENH